MYAGIGSGANVRPATGVIVDGIGATEDDTELPVRDGGGRYECEGKLTEAVGLGVFLGMAVEV